MKALVWEWSITFNPTSRSSGSKSANLPVTQTKKQHTSGTQPIVITPEKSMSSHASLPTSLVSPSPTTTNAIRSRSTSDATEPSSGQSFRYARVTWMLSCRHFKRCSFGQTTPCLSSPFLLLAQTTSNAPATGACAAPGQSFLPFTSSASVSLAQQSRMAVRKLRVDLCLIPPTTLCSRLRPPRRRPFPESDDPYDDSTSSCELCPQLPL